MTSQPELITSKHRFADNFETIVFEQEIPDEFFARNAQMRHDSLSAPMGDFHQFASIPQFVTDRWFREGFNIYEESLPAIIAKINAEDSGYFLTTKRHI